MKCTSRVIEDKERCRTYKIKELGKEKLAKAVLIVSEGILKCSCQLYETKGIPCGHILFVLRLEDRIFTGSPYTQEVDYKCYI